MRFRTLSQLALLLLSALFAMTPASAQSKFFAQPLSAEDRTSQVPQAVRTEKARLTQHYDPSKTLRVTIALAHPHLQYERDLIDRLHDKKSPLFHKWLTSEEWDAKFAPSAEDEQAVVDWAKSQGLSVTKRYPDRLLVDVVASAGALEKAFQVTINNYGMEGKTYYANDRDPVLPSSIAGSVHAVLGLDNFLQLRPAIAGGHEVPARPDFIPGPPEAESPEQHANGSAEKLAEAMKAHPASKARPQITNGYYDPSDIYNSEAYDWNALQNLGHCCNPNNNPGVSPPQSTIAIAAFADVNFSDVEAFQSQYSYLAYNLQKKSIDGTYTCNNQPGKPDDGCLEVSLDTEWSMAMANSFGSYATTAKVWIYEGANYGDIYDVYNTMASDGYAQVTSTSWGCPGEIGCYISGGMDTLDGIFNKMVGEGWTILAASGDQGASAGCGDGDAVQFPASDPNVVGAGGTYLALFDGPVYDEEVGWTGGTYTGACGQNNGGSTGGFSAYWGSPSYQSSFGYAQRSIPDIALNAAGGQNMYFAPAGGLIGVGGTSIVAPELAGFFAQENAYGLYLGNVCGGSGTAACSPIGNADYYLYTEGHYQNAPHYPFYDITSGCNSNDITAKYGLGYYCAGTGYDQVTGWGSANMLQLAWSINYNDAAAVGNPSITFGGPATNTWYNTDQIIDWDVNDYVSNGVAGTGIAGFTQQWDSAPVDVYAESTPGAGNLFYSGPQHPNSSFGCTDLNGTYCNGGVSQGCHTIWVYAWDNMGIPSGDQSYGPVCYDTVPPTTILTLSGKKTGSVYTATVTAKITASDPGSGGSSPTGSGLKAIYYSLDGGSYVVYTSPLVISATGAHTLNYYGIDVAGNYTLQTASIPIESPTATTVAASSASLTYGTAEVLTATITTTFGSKPTGTVSFYDNNVLIGSSAVNSGGTASFSSSTLTAGSQSFKAVYGGSVNDESSTSTTVAATINPAGTTTKLVSSANPATYEEPVTLTATVKSATTGTPTGTVTFKNGATTLGTGTLSGGVATLSFPTGTPGTYSITAVYNTSTDFLTSSSTVLSEVVKQVASATKLVSSSNPSSFGAPVTFTATVTSSAAGTPTGTVAFKNGTTTLGTVTLSGGAAKFTTTTLPVATNPIVAVYSGSAGLLTSTSSTINQAVKAATTTTALKSSLNPSTSGQSVTFTATVASPAGTPTGTVDFYSNGTEIGTGTLAAGSATFTTTTLATGTDSIVATYVAATDYATSTSSTLKQKVNP